MVELKHMDIIVGVAGSGKSAIIQSFDHREKVFIIGIDANYLGPLYIDIVTSDIIPNPDGVNLLNNISDSIRHRKKGITTWVCSDKNKALRAVLFLQNQKLPFILTGKNEEVFLVQNN